jgi:hypothetical protein
VTATGKWAEPGVPHRGWSCVGVSDLGEVSETCAMCETAEIRFVHHMIHPDYPGELGCGCICAEHMEGDYLNPRRRERALRNRARRRQAWPERRSWRLSAKGNPCIVTPGFVVTVFRKGGGWSAAVKDRRAGAMHYARCLYPDEIAAQLAAFDAMTFLEDRRPDAGRRA